MCVQPLVCGGQRGCHMSSITLCILFSGSLLLGNSNLHDYTARTLGYGAFSSASTEVHFYKVSISIHNIIHKFLVYLDYKLQLQEGEAVSLQVYVGTQKLTPHILVSCTNFGRNDDVHVLRRSINKYIFYRPRMNIIFGRNRQKINTNQQVDVSTYIIFPLSCEILFYSSFVSPSMFRLLSFKVY